MGVAGSGKSTLARAMAAQLHRAWLEGDEFHSDENRRKMAEGRPLTDSNRASWLARLCEQLQQQPGALLACSALKRRYRDQLRAAAPGLRFAYLDITPAQARQRVMARGGHFFAASLMTSQFDTLEPPVDEAGVLHLDALQPLDVLAAQISAWMAQP
jgi:gluconokinase